MGRPGAQRKGDSPHVELRGGYVGRTVVVSRHGISIYELICNVFTYRLKCSRQHGRCRNSTPNHRTGYAPHLARRRVVTDGQRRCLRLRPCVDECRTRPSALADAALSSGQWRASRCARGELVRKPVARQHGNPQPDRPPIRRPKQRQTAQCCRSTFRNRCGRRDEWHAHQSGSLFAGDRRAVDLPRWKPIEEIEHRHEVGLHHIRGIAARHPDVRHVGADVVERRHHAHVRDRPVSAGPASRGRPRCRSLHQKR